MSLPGLDLSSVCKKELKFFWDLILEDCLSPSVASTSLLLSCT